MFVLNILAYEKCLNQRNANYISTKFFYVNRAKGMDSVRMAFGGMR
jgi:hypothetical protein